MEKSLTRIECELKEAKGDIESLRQEVASREDKAEQSRFCWEDEAMRLARVSTHAHAHTQLTEKKGDEIDQGEQHTCVHAKAAVNKLFCVMMCCVSV